MNKVQLGFVKISKGRKAIVFLPHGLVAHNGRVMSYSLESPFLMERTYPAHRISFEVSPGELSINEQAKALMQKTAYEYTHANTHHCAETTRKRSHQIKTALGLTSEAAQIVGPRKKQTGRQKVVKSHFTTAH